MGKAAFLSLFGLDDIPSIKLFSDKIMNEPLDDAVFLRCFVAVSLGCFLCPNSNTKLSTKYMGAVVDEDQIKDIDWPKFIHQWLIMYIKKYLIEKKRGKRVTTTLGGCIYHLAVRCLDFVDFGSIKLPSTMPRTKVWKGNLIKCFSDMFMDRDGKFGALLLKDIEDTCYRQGESYDVAISKELLSSSLGSLVNNKAKECIAASFKIHMKNQDRDVCLRAQCLVRSIVEAIVSANDGSQDTVKLESSQDKQNSNDYAINSGSTEKIQTDDDIDEVEDEETCAMQDDGKMEGLPPDRNFVMSIKTASLDHMLPEDDNEAGKSVDINMLCSKFKPSLDEYISNNGFEQVQVLTTHADFRNSGFAGFRNIGYNETENKSIEQGTHGITENNNVVLKPTHQDIDINLPNITNIAEHYAKIEMKQGPKK